MSTPQARLSTPVSAAAGNVDVLPARREATAR